MKVELTNRDKFLLRVFQEGLPVVSEPFTEIAKKAGWEKLDAINRLVWFKEKGIIRRVSVFVRQREVGFGANAMVAWDIPDEQIEIAGGKIAESSMVSHCYERIRTKQFPYNIYSMTHAQNEDAIITEVDRLSKELGINKYVVLFTKKELKRSTPVFFTEIEK